MISLQGGLAEGAYAVKRAPLYLRGVLNTLTGEKDVLDQRDDVPGDNEEVSVYKLQGEAGVVHLNAGKLKGFYATGTYNHVEDVRGVDIRDTMDWRQWVVDQLPEVAIDIESGRII